MNTVMLYDDKNRNMNKCMTCTQESVWIIFGCLPYCDDCLPEDYQHIREEVSE